MSQIVIPYGCRLSAVPVFFDVANICGEGTFAYICGMKRESFVRLMVRGAADFSAGLAWEPLCPVCRAVLWQCGRCDVPQCMLELPRTMMWLSGAVGAFCRRACQRGGASGFCGGVVRLRPVGALGRASYAGPSTTTGRAWHGVRADVCPRGAVLSCGRGSFSVRGV